MNRLEFATLLSWAGEQGLQGRKRLQKVVYLLQRAGCPLGCRYRLHHFGPYSMDVADICDEMVEANLVVEGVSSDGNVKQYAYHLADITQRLLADAEEPPEMVPFEQQAKKLIEEDIWSLELGSTILLYQEEHADWEASLQKACEFKEVDSGSDASKKALLLAKRVLASQT